MSFIKTSEKRESVFLETFRASAYSFAILFNENLSKRALAKILRARASEHSSTFREQLEQRPNVASTFKLTERDHLIARSKGLRVKSVRRRQCRYKAVVGCPAARLLKKMKIGFSLPRRYHFDGRSLSESKQPQFRFLYLKSRQML